MGCSSAVVGAALMEVNRRQSGIEE
jgi:hypothetical protein